MNDRTRQCETVAISRRALLAGGAAAAMLPELTAARQATQGESVAGKYHRPYRKAGLLSV